MRFKYESFFGNSKEGRRRGEFGVFWKGNSKELEKRRSGKGTFCGIYINYYA